MTFIQEGGNLEKTCITFLQLRCNSGARGLQSVLQLPPQNLAARTLGNGINDIHTTSQFLVVCNPAIQPDVDLFRYRFVTLSSSFCSNNDESHRQFRRLFLDPATDNTCVLDIGI